jgi:hypothetical protein
MERILAALIAAGLAGGCVSGIPYCCALIAPARYDVGPILADGKVSGAHVGMGMSSASWSKDPATPFDVSLGYVVELHGADAPEMDKPSTTAVRRGAFTLGGYLEGAMTVAATRHQRSFVGLRVEVVSNDPEDVGRYGFGLTARAAWEVLRTGEGKNWRGVFAAGVFVEATTRQYEDGLTEHLVVTGMSFRVPAAIVPINRSRAGR